MEKEREEVGPEVWWWRRGKAEPTTGVGGERGREKKSIETKPTNKNWEF